MNGESAAPVFLPERLRPDDPVIGRIGLGQAGEAIGVLRPVELPRVDQDAADRGAVTTYVLGRRMRDDIDTVIEGSAENRTRHGVVEHQR